MPSVRKVVAYRPDDFEQTLLETMAKTSGLSMARVIGTAIREKAKRDGLHARGEGLHARGEGLHARGEGLHARGEGRTGNGDAPTQNGHSAGRARATDSDGLTFAAPISFGDPGYYEGYDHTPEARAQLDALLQAADDDVRAGRVLSGEGYFDSVRARQAVRRAAAASANPAP